MLKLFRRNAWRLRHAALLAALLAIALYAARDAWADIWRIALRDEESSHILLAPLAVLWLVWVRRGRLRRLRPVRNGAGPVLLLAGAGLYLLGYEWWTQLFFHAGAVLLLLGAVVTVGGNAVLRSFLPACLGLAFLLPVPGGLRRELAIPLQTTTAQVTQFLLELGGLPVSRTGNLLNINGVPVGIAEACNGMRMVFSLLLISYLFCFIQPMRNRARLALLLATPVTAVLLNVVRLVPTLMMYGYAPKAWADAFHDWAGWVMIGVGFFLLMGVVELCRWISVPILRYEFPAAGPGAAGGAGVGA